MPMFKVLSALLERPGQIVTREELRQLIWPEKSFGDFDHAINLVIGKLRETLGDSAEVPHLIETNKIVFASNRMGYGDIWMCDRDGSNCAQITDLQGDIGNCSLVSGRPLPRF
jgi:hypothetical protein